MNSYYIECISRYPEDGSANNYAYGAVTLYGETEGTEIAFEDVLREGNQNALMENYSVEMHGVHPTISARACERIARTMGERIR